MAGAEAAPLQNAQLVVEEQQGFLTGFPPFTKSFPSFSSSNPQSGPILQTHPCLLYTSDAADETSTV